MTWKIVLCAYMTNAKSDFGHAFVCVKWGDKIYATAGLSPANLPDGVLDEIMTIYPGAGKIYSEWDSLENENLRTREWDVSQEMAILVLNQINRDRSEGKAYAQIPEVDHLPAHQIVKMAVKAMGNGAEWSGGPDYALLWSTCATYALDLVALAGIDVHEFRAVVKRPSAIYGLLT